jgi:hypothetical protein
VLAEEAEIADPEEGSELVAGLVERVEDPEVPAKPIVRDVRDVVRPVVEEVGEKAIGSTVFPSTALIWTDRSKLKPGWKNCSSKGR